MSVLESTEIGQSKIRKEK